MNIGISTLHGAHHVAQKFSNTTFPRSSDSRTGLPLESFSVKSGAIVRFSRLIYTLLGIGRARPAIRNCRTQPVPLTPAEKHRSAKARVTGIAISERQVAIAPATTQVHRRRRPFIFPRWSRSRASPR